MSNRRIVIAIDGPAGAGKSTVSKLLAKSLGLQYLDTGAMYRALALKSLGKGIPDHDETALAALMDGTVIVFGNGEPQPVSLDGADVTAEIRTPEIGELASKISTHPQVRQAMVERQQDMVREGGFVLEGRDTTTVVAPGADVKIYLTASLEERAKRRSVEFDTSGADSRFEEVRSQILERDHRDITRGDSPLKVAEGAVVVESHGITPEQVAAKIIDLVRASESN